VRRNWRARGSPDFESARMLSRAIQEVVFELAI
jgi:hypothetical protein